MTAALLDRLTHRCHIFEMNGESHRFRGVDENQEDSKVGVKSKLSFLPKMTIFKVEVGLLTRHEGGVLAYALSTTPPS